MAFDPKDIKKDPDIRELRRTIEPWARDIETPKGGFVRFSAVGDGPAQDNENEVAKVDERAREERATDANHARRGEAIVGGRRRGAAAASKDAQKNPGEGGKNSKKKDNFDMQLMMLNQQLTILDAKIADFEEEIFSQEELAQLNDLPEDQQYAAKDNLLREKLANGEITQEQYEQWKKLQAQRHEITEQKERLENSRNVEAEVQQAMKTEDGKQVLNSATAELNDANLQNEIIEAKGYDSYTESLEKQGVLESETALNSNFQNEKFSFSAFDESTPMSAADTVEKTPINAPSIKQEFTMRSNPQISTEPNTPTVSQDVKIEPTFG